MRSDEVVSDVLQEAKRLACDFPGGTWYGFGSFFKGQIPFGDIDILVVCATAAHAMFIRSNTEDLCARWPLHLLVMTENEQTETGFVGFEGCTLLYGFAAGR